MKLFSRRYFWYVVVGTTLIRLLLAYSLPLTTDEAYFTLWGRYPAWGYYDHPPMTGWVLATLSYLADSYLLYRTFSVATGLVTAGVIYFITSPLGPKKARTATMVFLLSPVNIMLILITNDVVLLFFSVLCLATMYCFLRRGNHGWLFLAGLLAGAAFLSKYFAAFVILGILLYILFERDRYLFESGIFLLGAIPFFLQHLVYNAYNCWMTFVFNFVSRSSSTELINIESFSTYIVFTLYVIMPWGLWHLLKNYDKLFTPPLVPATYCGATGFSLLALASLRREVGLHWFLILVPMVYVAFSLGDNLSGRRLVVWTSVFSGLHALIIFGLLSLPTSTFQGQNFYPVTLMSTRSEMFCKTMETLPGEGIFATSYPNASVLSHQCNRYIGVWKSPSKYGRQFDQWNNLRSLRGDTLLIIVPGKEVEPRVGRYFTAVRAKNISINGTHFTFVVGRGFDYESYKRGFLKQIYDTYYNPPEFLPVLGCEFSCISKK